MLYAIIMAGGIGSRFWPRSRKARPKQFLAVFGDQSLIGQTSERLDGLIPPERRLVLTNEDYVGLTTEELPEIPRENILTEPVGRNTAPCIAYAAAHLAVRDPEAVMVVLPADHLIADEAGFHDVLRTAVGKAEEGSGLVTIGITPTHPATGYGYIQFEAGDNDHNAVEAMPVIRFAEKPDADRARAFVDSGDFLWNSGMFIWKASAILEEIKLNLPEVHRAFLPVRDSADPDASTVREAFMACPSISIDHGVMEQARRVYVVPGDFGWNDVGDWKAVYDLSEHDENGNAVKGNVLLESASNNLVHGGERLIAVVGVDNIAVIDTGDALLVCSLDESQKVKTVLNRLKKEKPEYV